MSTFTGLVRKRRTSRLVLTLDRVARWTITLGGIATIFSVIGVCVFLFWVAAPLLVGGDMEPAEDVAPPATTDVLHMIEDDYRLAALVVDGDGQAIAFTTADGAEITREQLYDLAAVTCVTPRRDTLLLGYADGTLQFATVEFTAEVLADDEIPEPARGIPVDGSAIADGSLIAQTHSGQYRRQRLSIAKEDPLDLEVDAPVLRADFSETSQGRTLVALTARQRPDGGELTAADVEVHFKVRRSRYLIMEDRHVVSLSGARMALSDFAPDAGSGGRSPVPDHVLLTGSGTSVLLLWDDGTMLRVDSRDVDAPRLAETIDLVAGDGHVSALEFLIGKTTLLVGDDRGVVTSWFGTKPADAATSDGVVFAAAREFTAEPASPVTAIASSRRSRLFAVAHADGAVRVLQGTSAKTVAHGAVAAGETPLHIALCPKEDGVTVLSARSLHRFDLTPGHPEVSLASAFLPVWYEGATGPTHTWQSTSGSDDFEPKLGLWVLIFGTLKSTFYCLLFGVPLAILAAIYTSEFLHARWRARIKPSIELMASLPSVVLGFLAALVFAPIVAEYIVAVLCTVITVPLVFLLGAQLWQVLPRPVQIRAERWRMFAACVALPAGIALALGVAPAVEALMFGGDFKDWLALGEHGEPGGRGSAFGGWFLSLTPLAAFVAFLLTGRLFGGLGGRTAGLKRFGIGVAAAVVVDAALAAALTGAGLDLRGNFFGIYDQRNSLVVGFVMGFAVVPIIYTIAEDALSAVPEHLRAGSLGAGATPWQTAVRIVLPTAMSGVFSAVMIGFGRAVGETMIVVMATGSTPVLDLNVFNGFRTLSACIAIELPEAVRDSTHYRMLYLAALCLFVMTFALNTIAEVVRQRFRKRAFQL